MIPRCVKNTNVELKCYKCKIYLHTNGVIMVGREWTRGGGGGCDDGSCRGAGLRDDVRGGHGGGQVGGQGGR